MEELSPYYHFKNGENLYDEDVDMDYFLGREKDDAGIRPVSEDQNDGNDRKDDYPVKKENA
jgi:protein involved in sex pheromone biosynthesis